MCNDGLWMSGVLQHGDDDGDVPLAFMAFARMIETARDVARKQLTGQMETLQVSVCPVTDTGYWLLRLTTSMQAALGRRIVPSSPLLCNLRHSFRNSMLSIHNWPFHTLPPEVPISRHN